MADKHTVTLWPPEYGAEPHVPIEVDPGQVERYKSNDWRDQDPNAVPDPPAIKRSDKKEKDAELLESCDTSD